MVAIILGIVTLILLILKYKDVDIKLIISISFIIIIAIVLTILAFREKREYEKYEITIDDLGIRLFISSKIKTLIKWNEMHKVEDVSRKNQILIEDITGTKSIQIYYNYENFTEIINNILKRKEVNINHIIIPKTFKKDYKTSIILTFISLIPLAIVTFLIYKKDPNTKLMAFFWYCIILFAIISLIVDYFKNIRSIHVRSYYLEIKKGIDTLPVNYSSIKDLYITLKESAQTKILDLILKLENNKEFSILPLGCNIIHLYQTVYLAWQQTKK